ncbi:LmeA family phospholipid-binding protein [Nocardia sp. CC227C]|uniref:LmeA family phospholipid-binding protein n=1 Tax=Nocardia sp. CC227C TaxID=3044562 RepID=UPI00278BD688|nr:LmeA family phospholipid-binding protein [Nocardia sp. CC227C]
MSFRRVIIGLLCLAGLAVVLDFGTAAYSEYRVSRLLREGSDLSADPEVTFRGFPFVAQAVDGTYDDIYIRARARRPDIPGEIQIESNLYGVRLPLSDLADGRVRMVPVDEVQASMHIEPIELGRLFRIPDLQVFGPPADKSDGSGGSGGTGMTTSGAIILTGTVPPRADTPPGSAATDKGQLVSVLADLRLDADGQIQIVATEIYHGEEATATPVAVLPSVPTETILGWFTRTIDTRDLPFGIRPTKVEAVGGQIVVEGRGRDVTVDLDQLQRQR